MQQNKWMALAVSMSAAVGVLIVGSVFLYTRNQPAVRELSSSSLSSATFSSHISSQTASSEHSLKKGDRIQDTTKHFSILFPDERLTAITKENSISLQRETAYHWESCSEKDGHCQPHETIVDFDVELHLMTRTEEGFLQEQERIANTSADLTNVKDYLLYGTKPKANSGYDQFQQKPWSGISIPIIYQGRGFIRYYIPLNDQFVLSVYRFVPGFGGLGDLASYDTTKPGPLIAGKEEERIFNEILSSFGVDAITYF